MKVNEQEPEEPLEQEEPEEQQHGLELKQCEMQKEEPLADDIHFTMRDSASNSLAHHKMINISNFQDMEEDYMGDIYAGVVIKTFPSIGTVKVKCLDGPFGNFIARVIS